MAVRASASPKVAAVRIISRTDDALDWDNPDMDFDKYLEDAVKNESCLKFKEGAEPTVFLCNFDFNGHESATIKNFMLGSQDKFSGESKGGQKMTMGSWAYMVAKYALKEIQNPADLPEADRLVLKKESGKYADDQTIGGLARIGIVDEIFVHYLNLTQKDQTKGAAKNS